QRGLSSEFNGALWLGGATAGQGRQLYKLGNDGSVTKWTAINTGGGGLDPVDITTFEGNAWLNGNAGRQLYKLGNDGSVTKWTAINTGGGGLSAPGGNGVVLVEFANALWFGGNAADGTNQLFKLGFDGSVTQWTATPGGFNPIFVGDGINTLPPLN